MKYLIILGLVILVGCSEILPESTIKCKCPECKPEIVEVYDTTKPKIVYVNNCTENIVSNDNCSIK